MFQRTLVKNFGAKELSRPSVNNCKKKSICAYQYYAHTPSENLLLKLKAMTGMDATAYIRSIRMRAACQILANKPNIRINELAERVGYSNPRYFSTCFKKEFGVTPREYNNEE